MAYRVKDDPVTGTGQTVDAATAVLCSYDFAAYTDAVISIQVLAIGRDAAGLMVRDVYGQIAKRASGNVIIPASGSFTSGRNSRVNFREDGITDGGDVNTTGVPRVDATVNGTAVDLVAHGFTGHTIQWYGEMIVTIN